MEDAGLEFLLDAVDRFPLREEFANNLEHPDPVPLALLLPSEASRAVPADSNAGSGCGRQVGSEGPEWAQVGVHRRPDASPTRSAQSTDRVNPEASWTKRLRLGSAPPDRTPCPSRMSALEQPIHKYAEEPTKSVVRPALGLSFDSLGRRMTSTTCILGRSDSELDMARVDSTLKGQSQCRRSSAGARGNRRRRIVDPADASVRR